MIREEFCRLAKALADGVLTGLGVAVYHAGLARFVIGLRRGGPRVLMYHAFEEVESDFIRGLAINTTPARFAAQLDFLQKYYRIVPLAALGRETVPDRAVVLTFDDGFRSVYEQALPQLRARNLPATCYLVTDVIDDPAPIWLNELNWFLRRHRTVARAVIAQRLGVGMPASMPVLIRTMIARYDPGTIAGLLEDLRSRLDSPGGPGTRTARLYLSREEIEEMSRAGFTFGNHTASHPVLPRLAEDSCHEEIRRAREVLRRLPGATRSLAYPFGMVDEATRRIARDLGYTTLMQVEGQNDPLDCLRIGRLNVTSIAPAALFARLELSGPLAFRIKRFWRGARARLHAAARLRRDRCNSPPR
jgi:peptidoglycan/xylan/chitin deacetylase (PgdA/CDA1 family)